MIPALLQLLSRRLLLAAAVWISLAATGNAQQDATSNAQQATLPYGVIRLQLDSRVHVGDDPHCAGGTDSGCTWERPSLAGVVGRVVVWRRVEVTLPEELRRVPRVALLAQKIDSSFEIFVNGRLLGSSPNMHWGGAGVKARKMLEVPTSLTPDGKLAITIRVNQTLGGGEISDFDLFLGSTDGIQAVMNADTLAYLQFNATHYFCFAIVGCAAFVFWLLFSVNTRLWEYLWLGAICLSPSLLRLVEISTFVDVGIPVFMTTLLWALCNSLTPIFVIEFIFSFLKRPVPWPFRMIQIAGFFDFYRISPLPAPGIWGIVVDRGTTGAILIATLSMFLMLPTCFRSKLPEMRWIGAAVLFFSLENAARMTSQLGLPTFSQDVIWRGVDIDLRGISYMLFVIVMLIAMTFRLRRIQDRNRDVEQEIAAARSVQQLLIPDRLPSVPGLAVESAYFPAQEVGGDFFQVLPLEREGGSAFVVLGDVSGKGLKAAMTVSLIVGALRNAAEYCAGPAALLRDVNRTLVGRGDGFATCLAMKISPAGQVTMANAAHPNPYINRVEISSENNLPLGLSLDVDYSEVSFHLEEGQRVTLVTDGVVEATSATTRELFGFERTQSVSGESAARIAEAARTFGLGAPQADDITVLTVQRVDARLSKLDAATASGTSFAVS